MTFEQACQLAWREVYGNVGTIIHVAYVATKANPNNDIRDWAEYELTGSNDKKVRAVISDNRGTDYKVESAVAKA